HAGIARRDRVEAPVAIDVAEVKAPGHRRGDARPTEREAARAIAEVDLPHPARPRGRDVEDRVAVEVAEGAEGRVPPEGAAARDEVRLARAHLDEELEHHRLHQHPPSEV